jgi:hypothetical protein
MNADHSEALVLLARAAGETGEQAAITSAIMTAVDRLGFQVRLRSGERVHGARIPFPREVRNNGEVRTVLIEMVRAARDAGLT